MNTLLFGFVIVGLASQVLTAPQTVNYEYVQQDPEYVQEVAYNFNAMRNAIESFVTTFDNAREDKIPDALVEAIRIIRSFMDSMFTERTINEAKLASINMKAYLNVNEFLTFMYGFFKDIIDSVESHKHIVPSAVEITDIINNFVNKMSKGTVKKIA
ncbi:hypothetical protein G9C98_008529 [Cotesia typhae]|uniref:Uncharacterized protein n=1 Tax=Cotesia typhae TaxID=2053667 RepID=A0A8J5QJ61_9HYME|nr:hypothetical protein G9C98_008529 [Cotesia typhae]